MPRDATGVRQNKSPHTTMCEIRNYLSSTLGIGNQFQRSCRMVTVGLYTARKPVEASSKICSANATHRANHALPKPDAESAGGACLMGSPVTNSQSPTSDWQSKIRTMGRTDGRHAFRPLSRNFTHQRQQVSFGVAKEGHPQIVRRHFRDYVRLVFEVHTAFFQFPECGVNVGYCKI